MCQDPVIGLTGKFMLRDHPNDSVFVTKFWMLWLQFFCNFCNLYKLQLVPYIPLVQEWMERFVH